MKIRYKKSGALGAASGFNIHAIGEVLTGDDTVYISDLDVWVEALGGWKDMREAFRDRDIIPDNYHTSFAEPQTPADRERGYF